MKRIVTALLMVLVAAGPVLGGPTAEQEEQARAVFTIGGGLAGLGFGVLMDPTPEGTPLAASLRVVIPAAAVATAMGALTGGWAVDQLLTIRPALIASPFLGAGLGLVAGALTGGPSFCLAFAIAIPTVEAPEGYWGSDFTYAQSVGMSLLAGAFWGGFFGATIGAVAGPILTLALGF